VRVAAASADRVANRPELWLPGGLAWLTTIGWIPFVAAIVRPPTVAELTYLGSAYWTSGLWPVNVILLAAAAVAVVVLGLALSSAGNAVLIAGAQGHRTSTRDAGHLLVGALIGAVPVALCVLTIAVAIAAVGPTEVNRPGADSGPVLRVLIRITPLLVFGVVVGTAASTLGGLAGRAAMNAGTMRGVAGVPALARRAGTPGLWHLAASVIVGLGFLVVSGLLLGVLWAPIRSALESGAPLDLAGGLLLVGFVAIWLCLVLAGGAVHAWASVTATVLLGGHTASNAAGRSQEMLLDR
jgi:hypothetical protein